MQICSWLDLARTETRGQGHSDLKSVGVSPGPKMYLHTKYGTATINILNKSENATPELFAICIQNMQTKNANESVS